MGAALTAIVVSATGCSDNSSKLERWESARHAAFSAFRDNKHDQAISKYESAIAIGREFGNDDLHTAIAQTGLAHVYAAQEKTAEATQSFSDAVAIFDKTAEKAMPPDAVVAYCDALEGLAVCDEKQGRVQECDSHFKHALYMATHGGLKAKTQDISFEYNSFRNQHAALLGASANELDKSTGTSKNAEQSALNEQYNKLFAEGKRAYQTKQFKLAEQKFLDASTAAEKLHSATGQADCATKLGAVYNITDQLLKSEKCYKFAEHLYERSQVASDGGNQECLRGLCEVLIREGKGLESIDCAQKLVDLARVHHAAEDKVVIEAEATLASACIHAQRYPQAIESFKRAEALAVAKNSASSPEVIMYSCWLTHLYFMANQPAEAENKLTQFVLKMETQPPAAALLAARLFNNYGEEMIKEGAWVESNWYFKTVLLLLAKTPEERVERERAQRHITALKPGMDRLQDRLQKEQKQKEQKQKEAAHKA